MHLALSVHGERNECCCVFGFQDLPRDAEPLEKPTAFKRAVNALGVK